MGPCRVLAIQEGTQGRGVWVRPRPRVLVTWKSYLEGGSPSWPKGGSADPTDHGRRAPLSSPVGHRPEVHPIWNPPPDSKPPCPCTLAS